MYASTYQGQNSIVHRHHGRDCQHQKEPLWNRPPWILDCFQEALRIPQPGSDDTSSQIKILAYARLSQKGGISGKGLFVTEGDNLQQPSLLLPKDRQGEDCSFLPYPSPRTGTQIRPARNSRRYTSKPLRSTQPTWSPLGRPSAFHAFHYLTSGLVPVKPVAKVEEPRRRGRHKRWEIGGFVNCLP